MNPKVFKLNLGINLNLGKRRIQHDKASLSQDLNCVVEALPWPSIYRGLPHVNL